jgi:CRISPR-associated protein Csm2
MNPQQHKKGPHQGANRGNTQPRGEDNSHEKYENDFQPKWVQDPNGFDESAIKYCKEYGEYLKNKELNTTQLRNIFGELRRIQLKLGDAASASTLFTQFLLMGPKVAYQAARAAKDWSKPYSIVFEKQSMAVRKEHFVGDFDRFMQLQEAILAYHKFYGGKDKAITP